MPSVVPTQRLKMPLPKSHVAKTPCLPRHGIAAIMDTIPEVVTMPAKHSDSKPGEKLLTLYTLLMLRGDHAISLGELASALECSKQTVLRLLDQLEASGYGKLEAPTTHGREHYYRMAKLPQRKLDMGVQELAQLALCRNMLMNVLPKSVSAMLNNIAGPGVGLAQPCASCPDGVQEQLGLVYSKGYIDYAPFGAQYNDLMQAMRQQRVCKIRYRRSPAKAAREFSFAPMRIVLYRENIAFLGWEVTDAGRAKPVYDNSLFLYLQRFESVALTSRKALDLPSPKTAQDCIKPSAFGIQVGEVFDVKLHFAPEATGYVYDRQWSSKQTATVQDDGSLILEIAVQSDIEAIAWILGFGSKVRVLEPEWLRDAVRAEAEKIVAGNRD